VGRTKVEIGEEEGILRKGKRKRPEKDFDGEESEEEEVVKEVEKVVRRMMRTAVGKRKLWLEEYADGNNDSGDSGKNPMDRLRGTLMGEKMKNGKALSELLKRKLSAELAAKVMSDLESAFESESDESESPEEDQMHGVWTPAGSKIRWRSKGTKKGVRRMPKIPDSPSSDGSVDSRDEETLGARREVKGTKALKGRQSKKIAEAEVSESEDEFLDDED
jgi:hypothetical protein